MSKNKLHLGLKSLKVKYNGTYVGTLALMNDSKVAFSYDEDWLENGFAISPFSLSLEQRVFIPKEYYFDGLFGIFADSLPDAWGRLLLDRMLKAHNIKDTVTVLDRLAMIGSSGMGALEYEPDYGKEDEMIVDDLDYISLLCQKILNTDYLDDLDKLYRLGGSSGGARPKILTQREGKDWIIKFPANVDSDDIGYLEYEYSKCAKKCGIDMAETQLFSSQKCKGYFGTVRFDVTNKLDVKTKIHTATAAAILEADFNTPCLDYHTLMKLTRILTHDNKEDVENMFRRACFNVFSHNRDDHAKNFSFMYNEAAERWRLCPAYDLTYSNTYFGEHTTSVDENGANPGEIELLNVGLQGGLKKGNCKNIIDEIREIVESDLQEFLK